MSLTGLYRYGCEHIETHITYTVSQPSILPACPLHVGHPGVWKCGARTLQKSPLACPQWSSWGQSAYHIPGTAGDPDPDTHTSTMLMLNFGPCRFHFGVPSARALLLLPTRVLEEELPRSQTHGGGGSYKQKCCLRSSESHRQAEWVKQGERRGSDRKAEV